MEMLGCLDLELGGACASALHHYAIVDRLRGKTPFWGRAMCFIDRSVGDVMSRGPSNDFITPVVERVCHGGTYDAVGNC